MTNNNLTAQQFEVSSISMSRKARKFPTGKDLFTGYLTLEDEKQIKMVEDFGLRVYKPEDGTAFIVVKVSEKLVSWKGNTKETLDTRYDEGNGYTVMGHTKVNIIKGFKDNNVFYRLTDILPSDDAKITKNERMNPFA